MLDLNIASNRRLREGDTVRHLSFPFRVVGFNIFESEPLVIQSPEGRLRSTSANEVEFVSEGPGRLEPLPNVVTILQEDGFQEGIITCSGSICLIISETNNVITIVPKNFKSNLREVYEESSQSFKETVRNILDISFVTRLPHLVETSLLTKEIDSLLDKDITESISRITELTEK